MPYMLLIIEDPAQRGTRSEAEGHEVYDRMVRFSDSLKASGKLMAVSSLKSQREGSRVQVREGRAQVVDGPFAEAKEMVGGFFLLNTDSRDEAMAMARDCPAAGWATVEVRETGPCYVSP
jgi:hypothetical protein